MSEKIANTSIQIMYKTAAVLSQNNYVLKAGQEAHESDTGKRKIGDGVTAYNSLPYIFTGGVSGISGLTQGYIPVASSATTIVDSVIVQSNDGHLVLPTGTEIHNSGSNASVLFNGNYLELSNDGHSQTKGGLGLRSNITILSWGESANNVAHRGYISFNNQEANLFHGSQISISTGKLIVNNQVQIADGSEGLGKYLVSDANGNASWDTLTSSDVGLGNVENTTLSTWAGSTNITTLGTIATGTWGGNTIAINKGGTNQTSFVTNGLVYFDGTSLTNNSTVIANTSGIGIGATPTSTNILYVKSDQNSTTYSRIENYSTGTSAFMAYRLHNGSNANDYFSLSLTGKSWTTSGVFLQNAGVIQTGSTISNGLSVDITAGDLRFYNNGTRAMTLLSTGQLLLGPITSASPTARLHILGAGATSNTYSLLIENSSSVNSLRVRDDGSVWNAGAGDMISNTAFGIEVLLNTTGGFNSGFGVESLKSNTTGYSNTGVGYYSLRLNTTGSENTAFGFSALAAITTGIQNTAIGSNAMGSGNGSYNNCVGIQAGQSLGGNSNQAMGYRALWANTSGNGNIGIGNAALYNNTSGSDNTVIGRNAMENNNGSGNVAVGAYAGTYETGSNKLFIDNATRANESDARIKSLVYGEFASTPQAQRFTVNAPIRSHNFSATDASSISALDGDIVYVNSTNGTFTSVGFWGYENGAWVKL